MPKSRLTGKIVSDKMEKTLIIEVERIKKHPLYEKRFKVHKRYKVHYDGKKIYNIGDKVIIEEARPLSKGKRWRVIKKI